ALRDLARASLRDVGLQKLLIDHAQACLLRHFGTSDPYLLSRNMYRLDERDLRKLSTMEWTFALQGYTARDGDVLRKAVVDRMREVAPFDVRVDVLESGKIDDVIRFYTPAIDLGSPYRLPENDPLKHELYSDLAPDNPLIEEV